VVLDGVVVGNIKLPDTINQAIEGKITQQQHHLAYEFILRRAHKEIERKRLEAEGIKKYNQIIDSSLTDNMLTWLGIQATKELAESPNAKILLFGGKNGLPVILNVDDAGRTAEAGAEQPPSGEKAAKSPLPGLMELKSPIPTPSSTSASPGKPAALPDALKEKVPSWKDGKGDK
jgi:hypothetical protein